MPTVLRLRIFRSKFLFFDKRRLRIFGGRDCLRQRRFFAVDSSQHSFIESLLAFSRPEGGQGKFFAGFDSGQQIVRFFDSIYNVAALPATL